MLFVLDLDSRYMHILGVTTNPDRPWTTQQARNPLMDLGDRAEQVKVLIPIRPGQFTATSDTVLADAGVTVCTIHPAAPGRTPTPKDSS
jgi:hypothetical protein